MSTLNGTDYILVERGDDSFYVTIDNMSNLQDTDLLLVNRGDQSFKITAADFKVGPTIYSVNLQEDSPGGNRYTSKDFTASSSIDVGVPNSLQTIDAYVDGNITTQPATDAVNTISNSGSSPGWEAQGIQDMNINGAPYDVTVGTSWWGTRYVIAGGFPNTTGAGQVGYSNDGITWTESNRITAQDWRWIAYGNGLFIITSAPSGFGQKYYSSGDGGASWDELFGVNGNYSVPVYGDHGYWIIITPSSNQWTASTSGAANTWSGIAPVPSPGRSWTDICYGDGKFVAISTNIVAVSPTNYTGSGDWTTVAVTETNWQCITYGNGMFVALGGGSGNRVMYSTDGLTWNYTSDPADLAGAAWNDITFGGDGRFMAVGPNSQSMWSVDGINWTLAGDWTTGGSYTWTGVTYGNDQYMAVSQNSPGRSQTMGAMDLETTLTFDSASGLSDFNVSDDVTSFPVGFTGTVKSISTVYNQMVLTPTSGQDSLEVGDVILGPLQTLSGQRRYLAFDSSGNVTSLLMSPQNPAYTTYQSSPSLVLKFPATFPSGMTPDQELGDGTTLTVSYTAVNTGGSSGPTTALVQPGNSSYLRSLTQAEFDQQQLKFATYDNRRMVVCGEDAVAARDALISSLHAAGHSLEDILVYL